ncbi:hypothetical protein NEISICOT_01912, partial [Neisseria sicca ATCC 29256]
NTQPPEGGWVRKHYFQFVLLAFQHTAARRRLGTSGDFLPMCLYGFNTQPPEGGWLVTSFNGVPWAVSTHSRPKAAGA